MVANNADTYASTRQNFFFPANNQTGADGNLTGQCVTLIKWFMNEMASVPSPFAARGDARYVGQTLVNQGLAVEVPFANRQRGDIICYEYGTYGHIAVQLSGGRVFEENVTWPGVATRVVDGETVHASRIGSESESWRVGKNPHVYRLKSYNEPGAQPQGDPDMVLPDQDNYYWRVGQKTAQAIRGRILSRDEYRKALVGVDPIKALEILEDNPEADQAAADLKMGQQARSDNWPGQIYGLEDQVKALSARPTQEQLDTVVKQATDLSASLTAANTAADQAKADAEAARKQTSDLEAEKAADEQTGNAFVRWLGSILPSFLKK